MERALWALLKDLGNPEVRCTLSAVECDVPNHGIEVGDVFDGEFVERLPEGVAAFGENGELDGYVAFEASPNEGPPHS